MGIISDGLQSLVERIEESLREEMPPEEKLLVMNRESFRYFERNHYFLDVIQRIEFFRVGARSACFEETRARMQGVLLRIFREFPSRRIFRTGSGPGGRGALGHDEGDPPQPTAPVAGGPPRAGDAAVPARDRGRGQGEGPDAVIDSISSISRQCLDPFGTGSDSEGPAPVRAASRFLQGNALDLQSGPTGYFVDPRCSALGILHDIQPNLDEFPCLLVQFHMHPRPRQGEERQPGLFQCGEFSLVLEGPSHPH